jgi:hypothetical protein
LTTCAQSAVGTTTSPGQPVFLKSEPPPDELRGTDVEFGSGDEQHPLLVLGTTLADELKGASLRGMHLRPTSN